jgi:diaminohydroxyphosphoribosylaminopyrimidine deaminase / 5-amino-6-(5-phosphoribosylamino)uracil reductase
MPSPVTIPSEINENPGHAIFMQRCLQLAALGAGFTSPNPLVGAVLVDNGRIIGEGYHALYGGPHAEVNCLRSVRPENRERIPFSTLYVSLEPCSHHGKTPPCTDLILREKISRVVIGSRDPFPLVNGKGIEKLLANGVQVEFPVAENAAISINHRFFTFHQKKRPWIILKWAESANHKMAGKLGERVKISQTWSNRLVHKWRTEEAAILIGTTTAERDNPELTARLWEGRNPVRIVTDFHLRLPLSLKIFDGTVPTIILNGKKEGRSGELQFKKTDGDELDIPSILSALYSLNMLSILVEGGARLLQSFIDNGTWDEMRIITNHDLDIPGGISAPEFRSAKLFKSEFYGTDTIRYYSNLGI